MYNRGPPSICALRLRKSPELLVGPPRQRAKEKKSARVRVSRPSLTTQPRRIRGNIRRDGLFGRSAGALVRSKGARGVQ